MPDAIDTTIIEFLLLWAFLSVLVYLFCDHALARFRRDPDRARIRAAGRYVAAMGFAVLSFAGSFVLIGLILAPSTNEGGRLLRGLISGAAVIVAIVIAAAVMAALRAIFGASRRPLPPGSLPSYGGGRLPFFAAASFDLADDSGDDDSGNDGPEDDSGDDADDFDTFKVFIAPRMLCVAKVSDTVDFDTGRFIPSFWSWGPAGDAMFYDAFDVTSPGFCQLYVDNFQFAWRDVASIDCDPVPKVADIIDAPNSGSITVRLKSGAAHELILLAKCDARTLRDDLQRIADSAA